MEFSTSKSEDPWAILQHQPRRNRQRSGAGEGRRGATGKTWDTVSSDYSPKDIWDMNILWHAICNLHWNMFVDIHWSAATPLGAKMSIIPSRYSWVDDDLPLPVWWDMFVLFLWGVLQLAWNLLVWCFFGSCCEIAKLGMVKYFCVVNMKEWYNQLFSICSCFLEWGEI